MPEYGLAGVSQLWHVSGKPKETYAMSKSAMVRARVEPDLKEQAEAVFHRLGLNATQAISMFYRQVELRNGLPFDVVVPTETTLRTFHASEAGRDLIVCESAEDMFRKLGI